MCAYLDRKKYKSFINSNIFYIKNKHIMRVNDMIVTVVWLGYGYKLRKLIT